MKLGVMTLGAAALAAFAAPAAAQEQQWRTAQRDAAGMAAIDIAGVDRSNSNEVTASVVLAFGANQGGADFVTSRIRVRCAPGAWQMLGGAMFTLADERLAATPPPAGEIPWEPLAGPGASFHQALCADRWADSAVFAGRAVDYARAARQALKAPPTP